MNQDLWQLHLENVSLRNQVKDLQRQLKAERQLTEQWRHRAMHGRPPGRATRKAVGPPA